LELAEPYGQFLENFSRLLVCVILPPEQMTLAHPAVRAAESLDRK
jgi:hypothetical protein